MTVMDLFKEAMVHCYLLAAAMVADWKRVK